MKTLKTYKQLFESLENKEYYINIIELLIVYSDEGEYDATRQEIISFENNKTISVITMCYSSEFNYFIYETKERKRIIDEGYKKYDFLDEKTLRKLYDNIINNINHEYLTYDNIEENIVDEESFNDVKKISDFYYLPYIIKYDTYDEYLRLKKADEFNI